MPTDEDLALQISQGHVDSLRTLVERHHEPLLGFLYRMSGGDHALAQDLAQEVFVRLLGSIARYQYPRPFKAWMYAIATNLARDHYKRADMRHTVSASDDELQELETGDVTWDSVLDHDEQRQLAEALGLLPDHQREVVIMRYYQELSLADIAGALDIPVGTVKSRLSLGLRRLRGVLEREEV